MIIKSLIRLQLWYVFWSLETSIMFSRMKTCHTKNSFWFWYTSKPIGKVLKLLQNFLKRWNRPRIKIELQHLFFIFISPLQIHCESVRFQQNIYWTYCNLRIILSPCASGILLEYIRIHCLERYAEKLTCMYFKLDEVANTTYPTCIRNFYLSLYLKPKLV